jgi:2-haloacid dehalogenase
MRRISAAVFDLGGVLIDWDPRHLYRKVFGPDEAAMERFLATVCTAEWNAEQDRGRLFSEAIAELVAGAPEHRANMRPTSTAGGRCSATRFRAPNRC